jgi:hypothetical protein
MFEGLLDGPVFILCVHLNLKRLTGQRLPPVDTSQKPRSDFG